LNGRAVRARRTGSGICLVLVASVLLAGAPSQAAGASGLGFSFTPSKTEPYAVCGRPTPGHSACAAILVPTAVAQSLSVSPQQASPTLASPTFTGSGVGGGYSPADLRSAYNLPSESAGSGQTVAIVDAFDDPNAESDLAVYRSHYGLPACTTANGCFKKVNQKGETTKYPSPEAGWAVEISLDIDMVSAACPKCHILLVEATSATNPTTGNLFVTDFGRDNVQEFSSAGSFIAAFGSLGSGAAQLSYPQGVAVGSTGHFFVADTANNRIEEWLTGP
jgi:subtilase family serine protease